MSFNYKTPPLTSNLDIEKPKLSEEENPYIVETAGFVPLQIRFKQLQEAGYRQRLYHEQFDGTDIEAIEKNAEFDILAGDDLETVIHKQESKARSYQQLLNNYFNNLDVGSDIKNPIKNSEKNEVFPESNQVDVNSQLDK